MVGWSILPRMTAGPGKDGEFNMFQTAESFFVGGRKKLGKKLCSLIFSDHDTTTSKLWRATNEKGIQMMMPAVLRTKTKSLLVCLDQPPPPPPPPPLRKERKQKKLVMRKQRRKDF